MKKILPIMLVVAIAMTGCASSDEYRQYIAGQTAIANAQSMADIARYNALSEIANSGDTAAKVAAVITLNQPRSSTGPYQTLNAPKSTSDTILQWSSLLLPNLAQFYSINAAKQTSIAQSNNATQLGIAQSNNATVTATNTANAFVSIAGKIQAPAPNVTLSGTGVIGAGSYSIGANSGANSGNSGRLAGRDNNDSTSTPTVVTQPAPIVVTQPAPIVVTQPAPIVVTQPAPIVVTQPATE